MAVEGTVFLVAPVKSLLPFPHAECILGYSVYVFSSCEAQISAPASIFNLVQLGIRLC